MTVLSFLGNVTLHDIMFKKININLTKLLTVTAFNDSLGK